MRSKPGRFPTRRINRNGARSQLDFVMPEGTTVLRVMLVLDGAGTVWLDDLKLEEVLADGRTVEVQRPARPVDHELMRQWIALYHGAGRPYLLLGKMLHPPRLESSKFRGRRIPRIRGVAEDEDQAAPARILGNSATFARNSQLRRLEFLPAGAQVCRRCCTTPSRLPMARKPSSW